MDGKIKYPVHLVPANTSKRLKLTSLLFPTAAERKKETNFYLVPVRPSSTDEHFCHPNKQY